MLSSRYTLICINAGIYLLFNISAYNLFESDETAEFVITVAKSGSRDGTMPPPPTEVDIPFIASIIGGTATFGAGESSLW